ncbi:adhesion G-protein coupled receptor G1 [Labrus bergylta]|uniref:Adhesion G protein-coupled receptor G1 n=1 Tax=Labrus bergylta TaxID=56723 RepID=A0A3Q3N1A9_9LABR|nr:adhesion G protein-coupled receptor G3-like [Labrus bergylta]XP_020487166.1 adhesion G protein-coupled receptor G3-like [Labrus bergylta]XP_020487167.1 adhesion G protein-coupled receptor G3-like [Labrus bergylta]
MEPRLTDNLMVFFTLIIFSQGSAEIYEDLNFCGTWRHGNGPLSLNLNLSTGCDWISISASKSSLSIEGQITALCSEAKEIHLDPPGSKLESYFCLYWEPLQDQLKLQFRELNLTLCRPASLWGTCCSQLSNGPKSNESAYGILNGSVKTDLFSDKVHAAYTFKGTSITCNTLLNEENQGSAEVIFTEDKDKGSTAEVEMKKDFRGFNITSPTTTSGSAESATTVQIPQVLKNVSKSTNKVSCTFLKNNSMFQGGPVEGRILNVVEITVGNDTIENLSDPIRISFHHDVIPKKHSRKCVSWDTKKDPFQVNWVDKGCETRVKGGKHTECLCDHLTFFAVLVQMEPRPVRHLLALTAITSLGCAVSVISCIALIIFLNKKSKRCKEQCIPIHRGLAISLALLNLLFFFTGVLANVLGESLCTWVGAGLHYTLLSSFSWMSIEVFHTIWLVYMVFIPSPKPYVWNLVGFALPLLPVTILFAVGDIYGLRKVEQSEDESDPYKMCWLKNNPRALSAHYFTIAVLAILVVSGLVMLLLVYKQIRTRDEWRQNKMALFSIWGLSIVFGITWGLTFLDFGPLSDFVLFLFCILNSFQGFLLMLRFFILDRMRKRAGGSAFGSTSTGSTRQHMLQAQEKS